MQISQKEVSMSATSSLPRPATLDDLAREPGKAELIGGMVVRLMTTGYRPNIVAGRIFRSLADCADRTSAGLAYTDNMGVAVPLMASGRQSFAPDAAYYSGPPPANEMKFVFAAPDFAVEVRSDGDYGPAADAAYADKRADYFAAGTKVVWDVDPVAGVIDSYRVSAPDQPIRFGPGDQADAEPAAPGWRVAVDWIMAR
jgi:Uma2 family endonuclease